MILLIFNLIFIWSNSMLNSDKSIERSDALKEIIKEIVISDEEANGDNSDNNKAIDNSEENKKNEFIKLLKEEISKINVSGWIRKMAHFGEFMTFGMILFIIKILNSKPQFFTVAFICLITAVIDEFIQSFSDRTDSVNDIIIDFTGSLTGILIVFLIFSIIKKIMIKKGYYVE